MIACNFFPSSTPWGELQRPQSSLSPPPVPLYSPPHSHGHGNEEDMGGDGHTPPKVLVVVEEATRRGSNNEDDDVMPATESAGHVRSSLQLGSTAQIASSSMSSSTSSLVNDSCSNLPQVLLDKVRYTIMIRLMKI